MEGNVATKSKKPRKTIIFTLYLYRRCPRALQEGVIRLTGYPGKSHKSGDTQFNHLDDIPRKIRQQLRNVALTYDVDDNSDDTVIEPKKRKPPATNNTHTIHHS